MTKKLRFFDMRPPPPLNLVTLAPNAGLQKMDVKKTNQEGALRKNWPPELRGEGNSLSCDFIAHSKIIIFIIFNLKANNNAEKFFFLLVSESILKS